MTDSDNAASSPAPHARASRTRFALLALIVASAAWMLFTWPLPRYTTTCIPFTTRGTVATPVPMTPGDHLQMLYHFWLFKDMVTGGTPWFHNLYEFNTGDDAERYEPSPCYMPFSIVCAAGIAIGGRAFGWNLTGLVALWLAYWLTVRLARRYTDSLWVAAVAALPTLVMPFRWESLLGGSPMGFAMLWPSAALLGLDIAVRDRRPAGGVLAGLAVLFASFTDTHAFFFTTLVTPAWCLVAFAARRDFRWSRPAEYLRLALALLPAVLLIVIALWFQTHGRRAIGASTMADGRNLREVLTFSPFWQGLFARHDVPMSNLIYIGYLLPGILLLGFGARLAMRAWRSDWRRLLLLVLCAAGLTGIILLALGPRGPDHGIVFTVARRLIHPYAMIRQTAKIFCLFPAVSAVALALALPPLLALCRSRAWARAVLGLVAIVLVAENRSLIRPGICRLDAEQGAYAAVAADAAARAAPPRAVAVTLWPGDTHYGSLYEHYASLYRVRMVNGYSPVVSSNYVAGVFRRFESINQGWLADDQADELLGRGIDYVLVHEDEFPEKVSPFPITFTLWNLLNNPRLQLLAQAGPVWAFRIGAETGSRPPAAATWNVFFPARRWEAEKMQSRGASALAEGAVGGGRFTRLADGAALEGAPVTVAPGPALRYMLRVRGPGELLAEPFANGIASPEVRLAAGGADWRWVDVPVPAIPTFGRYSLRLTAPGRSVDVDSVLFTGGAWKTGLRADETVTIPAACFFHAGHIRLSDNSVVLPPGGRTGAMFYGPKLPLEAGDYRVDFVCDSPAPGGTKLGEVMFNRGENEEIGRMTVLSGTPATHRLRLADNRPFHLVFVYFGTDEVAIREVRIARTSDQTPPPAPAGR